MVHKTSGERDWVPLPVHIPFPSLSSMSGVGHDVTPEPEIDISAPVAAGMEHPVLPEMYSQHEVAVEAEEAGWHWSRVRPLGIYADKVRYNQKQHFEGYYINDILSGTKWLVAIFKTHEMCDCSCRGYCTQYVMLRILLWAFEWMQEGLWPLRKFDGTDFTPSDGLFFTRRGWTLPFKGYLAEIRADWPAMNALFGFRSWRHSLHPCPLCKVTNAEMTASLEDVELDSQPWEDFTDEQYRDEVQRCTKVFCSMASFSRTPSSRIGAHRLATPNGRPSVEA